MAAPKSRPQPAAPEPEQERETPAYYIATQALYIGAARAHAVGARVSPEHVAKHGWQAKVRHPDDEPDAPAPAPTKQPATDQGQAPTSKEGE